MITFGNSIMTGGGWGTDKKRLRWRILLTVERQLSTGGGGRGGWRGVMALTLVAEVGTGGEGGDQTRLRWWLLLKVSAVWNRRDGANKHACDGGPNNGSGGLSRGGGGCSNTLVMMVITCDRVGTGVGGRGGRRKKGIDQTRLRWGLMVIVAGIVLERDRRQRCSRALVAQRLLASHGDKDKIQAHNLFCYHDPRDAPPPQGAYSLFLALVI